MKKLLLLSLVLACIAGVAVGNLGERRTYLRRLPTFIYLDSADPNNSWDPSTNIYTINGHLFVTDVNVTDDLSLETFTEGSVLFIGPAGLVSEDNANLFWDDSSNRLGVGLNNPARRFEIGSNDSTDRISIWHDNANAQLRWDDGSFLIQTDEGTNTNSTVIISGNGTGRGGLLIRDEDNAEYINIRSTAGGGYFSATGTSPSGLFLQHEADTNIKMFSSSASGETREVEISGYRAADSLRSLQIGVGIDTADTASFDGLSNYLFDGTIKSTAGAQLGDGGTTDYMEVEPDGDTFWVGDGGMLFGHMYVDGTQAIIVALTDDTPAEVEDDGTTSAEDGWLSGQLNDATFPTGGTEHYVTVNTAGRYEAKWDMSFSVPVPGANVEMHGGVAIDDTPTRDSGEAHRTIANVADTGSMGAVTVLNCPNGTEEISLWIENTTNNADASVIHGNLFVKLIGGPVTAAATDHLLLDDGASKLLLDDGVSYLLIRP